MSSSSDLYVFDSSFYRQHSIPEMVVSSNGGGGGGDMSFFTDSFSPFCDSSIDILQAISNNSSINHHQNFVDESSSVDKISHALLSCSPPSNQLENLSLYQQNANLQSLPNGYRDFSSLDATEVKSEDSHGGFDCFYNQQPFVPLPHSYSGVENVAKYMQRSFSSNSFDGKPSFLFQPRFDTLMESPNLQIQPLSSPENNNFSRQIRRVCSTGDLQNIRTAEKKTERSFSSALATESSFMEDTNFKVGRRYSAEERKERISKYRAKRNQRNFNKTIKYACRKTLADNRPRIRGRFARNDESSEIPKAACSVRDEDEDDFWLDVLHLHEDEEERAMTAAAMMRGEPFGSTYGQYNFHYYGCF